MRIFHFKLSAAAKKALNACNFDVKAFSNAFTSFYNTHFVDDIKYTKHHTITIRTDRRNNFDYGYYNYDNAVTLCGGLMNENNFTQKELFATILHEMMHWLQFNIYKWSENTIAPDDYYKCRAERMCRKFEKQVVSMMRIYKVLTKIQKVNYK